MTDKGPQFPSIPHDPNRPETPSASFMDSYDSAFDVVMRDTQRRLADLVLSRCLVVVSSIEDENEKDKAGFAGFTPALRIDEEKGVGIRLLGWGGWPEVIGFVTLDELVKEAAHEDDLAVMAEALEVAAAALRAELEK